MDLEKGKSARYVILLVAFNKSPLMLAVCRQLIPERQEGGNVPVCMPRRLI